MLNVLWSIIYSLNLTFIHFRLTMELGMREQKIAELNRKMNAQQQSMQEIVSTFQVGFCRLFFVYVNVAK